ncbi:hypothetical protein BH24PSE2_BH24PSE2_03410 [soil metagenome]
MRRLLLCATLLIVCTAPRAAEDTLPPFPRVEVETNWGSFILELDSARAPLSVRNFLQYVREGFYDNTLFHRVVPGFVAQGGGYNAAFEEKPVREPIPNEAGNGLSNLQGTIAMARTNDPHSANAQFFINLIDNPRLDPSAARWGYAVFGQVVEGLDVVAEIGRVETGPGGPFESEVPVETILIQRISVLEPEAAGTASDAEGTVPDAAEGAAARDTPEDAEEASFEDAGEETTFGDAEEVEESDPFEGSDPEDDAGTEAAEGSDPSEGSDAEDDADLAPPERIDPDLEGLEPAPTEESDPDT